jgi:hypothetical protein
VKAVAAVMISQDRMLVDNPLGCVEGILIILSKYFTFLDSVHLLTICSDVNGSNTIDRSCISSHIGGSVSAHALVG